MVEWLPQGEVDHVIISAGLNDVRLGATDEQTRRNIDRLIDLVRTRFPNARISEISHIAIRNLPEELRPDGLHPNRAGYIKLYADAKLIPPPVSVE